MGQYDVSERKSSRFNLFEGRRLDGHLFLSEQEKRLKRLNLAERATEGTKLTDRQTKKTEAEAQSGWENGFPHGRRPCPW